MPFFRNSKYQNISHNSSSFFFGIFTTGISQIWHQNTPEMSRRTVFLNNGNYYREQKWGMAKYSTELYRAFFLLDSEKSIFKCDRIYILSRNLVSISHFEVNENVPRERSTTLNLLFCRLIEFGMGTDLILRECFFFSAALYGQEMLYWFLGHDRNGVNFAIFRGKKGKFLSPRKKIPSSKR